jgi:hypothetical protein
VLGVVLLEAAQQQVVAVQQAAAQRQQQQQVMWVLARWPSCWRRLAQRRSCWQQGVEVVEGAGRLTCCSPT